MFKRIVVGAEESPEGRDAVALGAAIADVTGCGLTLLGAFTPYLIASGSEMDRRTQVRETERHLQAARRRFAPSAHIEAAAATDPARALLESAERWHADLIVIGSSSRAPAGHCAIGRTGRSLLEARPPALAIAARGLSERGAQLSTIAVGFDGGAESGRALEFADLLAAAADAQLLIRTVNRDPTPRLLHSDLLTSEFRHELHDGVEHDALMLAEQGAAKTAARSSAEASIGEPSVVFRELSGEVDVVVIGSRRWGPVAHHILGGVGEALAAGCGASLIITGPAAEREASLRESPHGDPRTTPTPEPDPHGRIVV